MCISSISFIEYACIDQVGTHPLPSKVTAIVQALTPTNLYVRSFRGLLHYYGKFVQNLATIVHSLDKLLQADQRWKRSEECAEDLKLPRSSSQSPNFLHTMTQVYQSRWQLMHQPSEWVL